VAPADFLSEKDVPRRKIKGLRGTPRDVPPRAGREGREGFRPVL
jgi:hypothetical protein